MQTIVIYHANCWDGFCAAWLLRKVIPDAEFIPAQYGQEPPDVAGKHVYIVDFSYKRPVMLSICAKAEQVVVLDHHETAEKELHRLEDECQLSGFCVPRITFDMSKSGGRLTWDYMWNTVYGQKYSSITSESGEILKLDCAPWLVDYTEDRDLWRWALPYSREINAYIRSFPLDFDLWTRFDSFAAQGDKWMEWAGQGDAILRRESQIIDEHIRHAREIEMDGHKILAVNATVLFSDIAGKLAEGRPFGAAYFDRGDGMRQWSLRSRDDGVPVSDIAKAHGGGGHRNAAGFQELSPCVPASPAAQ